MLFNKEHFGKPISKELSEILKRNTTSVSRTEVAAKMGIAASTVTAVTFRRISLTWGNHHSIVELMRVALQNAKDQTATYAEDEGYLLDLLESANEEIG